MLFFITIAALTMQGEEASSPQPIEPQNWITSDDYPAVAVRGEIEGIIPFRVFVDTAGRPTDCEVIETVHPVLGEATCRLIMERSAFRPARDEKGQPMASIYLSQVRWELADDSVSRPYVPFYQAMTVHAAEAGISHCTLKLNDQPHYRLDAERCRGKVPDGMLQYIEELGPDSSVTNIFSFVPAGFSAPAQEEDYGEALTLFEADAVIAPDGSIETCAVVRAQKPVWIPSDMPIDFCNALGKSLFEPAKDVDEKRAGRFTMGVYVRRGTAL